MNLFAEGEEWFLLGANGGELVGRSQTNLDAGGGRQRRRSVVGSADLQPVDAALAAAERGRRFDHARVLVHVELTGVVTRQIIDDLTVGAHVGVNGAGAEHELTQTRSVGDVHRVRRRREHGRVVVGVADADADVDAGAPRLRSARVAGAHHQLVDALLFAVQFHARVDETAARIDAEVLVAFYQRVTVGAKSVTIRCLIHCKMMLEQFFFGFLA